MDLRLLGETGRLCLQAPVEGDLEAIVTLWTDARTTEYTGGPRERDVVLTFFQAYANDPERLARDEGERWWSVLERSTGEWVGLCGLLDEEGEEGQIEAGLVYFLLPGYWSRGYATEAAGLVLDFAFEKLEIGSVVAVVDPRNASSLAVAAKLGMEVEREARRADGVVRRIYRLQRGGSEQ